MLAPPSSESPWSAQIRRTIAIGESGLVLGLGSCLARMTKGGTLAIEDDRERMLALLSVADRRPVSPGILHDIEAASGHWQRGDRALANLRLVFAGLPRLDDPADAWRLCLAEALLDEGLPPRILMTELGFDLASFDVGKFGYDPNQARVPAGNGRESGRWEAFWSHVATWLEEPVPEYDLDTGTEVGTRTRGRAIATNPITVLGVGAAALLGGEAVVGGAAVAEEASPAIQFAQQGISAVFRNGEFAGQSIEDVVLGLKNGNISADQLPLNVITRNGTTYTLNNRSLMSLRLSGQRPTIVNDMTGDSFFENQLDKRLSEIEPNAGSDFVPIIRGK